MTALVRRAGRASLPDGDMLTWTVADGRRGRRWRVGLSRAGGLTSAMLLEVGLDGRVVRLELATAVGLLTLHPEASASLHGNVVTEAGVRHLALNWSDDHALEIDGQPIATAVTAARLAASVPPGEGRTVPIVAIGSDLAVGPGERRFRRLDEATWAVDDGARVDTIAIDGDGLPVWPEAAGEWPLELDPAG